MRVERRRGYEVFWDRKAKSYRYRDTDELVDYNKDRPCALCGLEPIDGQDACIAHLPGVIGACCGHGYPEYAVIAFSDGTVIQGFQKIERDTQGFEFALGVRRNYEIQKGAPPTKRNWRRFFRKAQ